MSFVDGLLAAGILVAAGWLLYRTIVKNKNGCAGCSGCSGGKNDDKGKDRLVRLS